jgi:hypothetical protein
MGCGTSKGSSADSASLTAPRSPRTARLQHPVSAHVSPLSPLDLSEIKKLVCESCWRDFFSTDDFWEVCKPDILTVKEPVHPTRVTGVYSSRRYTLILQAPGPWMSNFNNSNMTWSMYQLEQISVALKRIKGGFRLSPSRTPMTIALRTSPPDPFSQMWAHRRRLNRWQFG